MQPDKLGDKASDQPVLHGAFMNWIYKLMLLSCCSLLTVDGLDLNSIIYDAPGKAES